MKFYIASSIKNYRQVRQLSDKLKEAGWMQTFDWTMHLSEELNSDFLRDLGQMEFDGVKEADVVILLTPGGKGTHTELGMAIALNKTVYLCHEDHTYFEDNNNTSTFYWLPQINRLNGIIDVIAMNIIYPGGKQTVN